MCKNKTTTNFKICSHTQKMTLNLIGILKTSIYSPKQTKQTNIHIIFQHFRKNKNKTQSSELLGSKKSGCYADLYDIIYIVEGHTT